MNNFKLALKIIVGCIFVIISAQLTLLFPKILQVCLDELSVQNKIIEHVFQLVVILISNFIVQSIYIIFFERLGENVFFEYQKKIINKISASSYAFYNHKNIGDLSEIISKDCGNIMKFISKVTPQIISQIAIVIGVLAAVYLEIGFIPFALFLVTLTIIGYILFYYKKSDEKNLLNEREAATNSLNIYSNLVKGRKTINSLNLVDKANKIIDENDNTWMQKREKAQSYLYNIWALSILMGSVLSSLSIFVAGFYYELNILTIGHVYLFFTYSKMLLEPIEYIQSTIQSIKNYI